MTTLKMLNHIYDGYARITQGYLEENDKHIK